MDLNKLTIGDKVLAASGIVFFISTFLKWFGIESEAVTVQGITVNTSVSYSETGWDYFLFGIIPALLVIAIVTYVLVTKLGDNVKLPELPVPAATAVLGAAGLSAALVILKLLIGQETHGVDLDRKYGIFVATIAIIGVAAGAFLNFKEEADAPGTSSSATPPGESNTPF